MTSVAEIYESMEYGPAPESASAAQGWLRAHSGKFDLYIDGRWIAPKTGQWFDTIDPTRNAVLAQVAQAGKDDVDDAVAAARRAQPLWAALPGHQRARHLYALARLVQRHARLLSVVETLDNGKPIRETRDIDIPLVARHFYHHAGWAQLADSELKGLAPIGVVGQVIPWNFPILMAAWKIAPALAAGNAVVLKPAEFTPLSALLFAELVDKAGIPKGVVNIITGDGSSGAHLVAHEGVDKIAFTGSTEVGRIIRKATAGSGKHLTLELGGKSPFIVFNDADLDSAVEGVVDAIWFNQGQVCCAGSRLLVQEDVAPRFIAKLKARMETLRVGDPLDKCVDIGAIVAPVQLQRIDALVKQGVSEGAKLFQPSWAVPTEGCFYPPTLFTDVHPASTIVQEEIFGPVLVSMTFRTPDEAVELANNTRYGLAASVWSESINLALDIAPRLQCGVVWVNSTNVFDAACGFGGYRESGFGREGGIEGMHAYLHPAFEHDLPRYEDAPKLDAPYPGFVEGGVHLEGGAIDRTPKLYIGGKQVRPDATYSRAVVGAGGKLQGEVGLGTRKDIRDAVEAARADPLLRRGEPRGAAQRFCRTHRGHDRRRARCGEGSRRHDRAAFLLRCVGRQVRRRRAQPTRAQRHDRDERAHRHHRRRVPRRGAAARLHLAGRARDRRRQSRHRGAVGALAARRDRPLSSLRHLRRARRRRQHRHRHARRARQGARRSRRGRLGVVRGPARGQPHRRAREHRQHEAHVGELRAQARLVRSHAGRGPRAVAPRGAGQERVGSVRRMSAGQPPASNAHGQTPE
ncbi:MAG TPA: aldehyde dehydrogenase family protein [Nannocystaceae bacterium]|nr:aldehyde dehydrogenase family protein [Nannocystaceae bacterium]